MSSETPTPAPAAEALPTDVTSPEAVASDRPADPLPQTVETGAEPSAAPFVEPTVEPPSEAPGEPIVEAAAETPVEPAVDAAAGAPSDSAAEATSTEAADAAGVVATAPAGDAAAGARMDLDACSAELKQRFPALFTGAPKPIKLRIQADIQQRAPGVFTRQALSAFLRRYTGSTSYLIALGKATQRLDLDGQPAGEIAPEHHEAAVQELVRRRELRREREQALRKAQRPPRDAQPLQAVAAGQTDAARPDAASPRPPHPPRPPRPPRPPGPQGDVRSAQGLRPQGEARSAQGPRPLRDPRPAQAPRPAQPQRQVQPPRPIPPPAAREAQPAEDPGRRERMQLLRAFDSSPLTKANFCALKGMTVEHLDAQLVLARQEAAAWAAAHPQPDRMPDRGPDRGHDPRSFGARDGPRDGPRDNRPEGRPGGPGGPRGPGAPSGPRGPRRDGGPAKGGAR